MASFVYSVIGFSVILGFITVSNAQLPNKTFKVVSVLNRPYLFENDNGEYEGFVPDLLNLLGLKYELKVTERYGQLLPNGKWVGMVKEIVDGTADIAGILTSNLVRSQAVDFAYPVETHGAAILMKKPTNDKPSLTERLARLLEPMEFSVWLITILAMLVTGTVLYIIAHYNPYEWRNMYKDREASVREAESFTCMNSFWFVISTLMWQGYVRAPRSVGARILVTSWWAFVVIFLLSYTASLTNYLRFGRELSAVKGFSKIRSFKDLAENEDMRVGVLPGGSTENTFGNSNSDIDQQIFAKIVKSRTNATDFESVDELITYIRNQRYTDFAGIIQSATAKYASHQLPCNLYMITVDYRLATGSFAVQKGSALKSQLSALLMKHHESGDIHYLENKWFKPKCTSSNVVRASQDHDIQLSNFYALDLGTFSAALMILVVGIILGCFVTLVETCVYKWAETRVEDDEQPVHKVSADELNTATSEKLLPQEEKRGGATQV